MFYVLHGRVQQSGAEVTMQGAQVCRWRDGLLVYAKLYVHREDALKDLGISEDALKPIAPQHLGLPEQDLTPTDFLRRVASGGSPTAPRKNARGPLHCGILRGRCRRRTWR
jgi:hypothetical protein